MLKMVFSAVYHGPSGVGVGVGIGVGVGEKGVGEEDGDYF